MNQAINQYENLINELKERGESLIKIENGVIHTKHGKATYNTWIIEGGKLKCIGCYTRY